MANLVRPILIPGGSGQLVDAVFLSFSVRGGARGTEVFSG